MNSNWDEMVLWMEAQERAKTTPRRSPIPSWVWLVAFMALTVFTLAVLFGGPQ